jgi:hypothetical protein
LSHNRKSAQKGVKRRQKAQKGDFMAEKGAHMAPKGAHMAPKGAKMRILAPFGAFWRNGKKHSVFQLFFNIFF